MSTPFDTTVNNGISTLAVAYTAGGTTLTVASGDGAKFGSPTPTNPGRVTLITAATVGTTSETLTILTYTGRTGDQLTGVAAVTNGPDASTDRNYAVGDAVQCRLTKGQYDAHSAAINTAEGNIAANTSAIATNTANIASNTSAIATKANKVAGATAGNFASLSVTGDLVDSTFNNASFLGAGTRLDQLAAPLSNVALNSKRITGLADPSSAQDAATKAYVDGVATGLDVKASVRAASTANVALTGGATLTIDGVSLANGDRVLLKDQTTGSQNGLYAVSGIGSAYSLTRSTDADTSAEVTAGLFTFVTEGTANGDKGFVLTTNDPITLGTTSLAFSQFSGGGGLAIGNAVSGGTSTEVLYVDGSGNLAQDSKLTYDATNHVFTLASGANIAAMSLISMTNRVFQVGVDNNIGCHFGRRSGVAVCISDGGDMLPAAIDAAGNTSLSDGTMSLGRSTIRWGQSFFTSIIFGGSSTATTETDKFPYIPVMAGAPTGTPTTQTGRAPMVFDSTNNKIWIYIGGAWKGVVVS